MHTSQQNHDDDEDLVTCDRRDHYTTLLYNTVATMQQSSKVWYQLLANANGRLQYLVEREECVKQTKEQVVVRVGGKFRRAKTSSQLPTNQINERYSVMPTTPTKKHNQRN